MKRNKQKRPKTKRAGEENKKTVLTGGQEEENPPLKASQRCSSI